MRNILYLLPLLFAASCVSPVADPTEDIDTRQVADSTAGDSARFTTTIKPWEPGGTIVGHRQ